MKKIAVFLIICMLALILAGSALASDSGTWDDVTWTLDNNGVLTVSGTGPITFYNTDSAWLAHKNEIRKVIIGNGVTSIGDHAFSGCRSLTGITIPDSVTSIGKTLSVNAAV